MTSRSNYESRHHHVDERQEAPNLPISGARKVPAGLSRQVAALISAYERAVAESRALKQPVRFVVSVGLRGNLSVHPLDEAGRDKGAVALQSTAETDSELTRALTAARRRGQARIAEILSGDDMLSADQFAALIGTSRVTVNTKRQSNQVLGLEGARRGFRFPEWQIGDDGKPFSALSALFDRLDGSAWAVYRFLVQHHPELDGLSGREALHRGRADEVLEVAESVMRAPA